MRSSPVSVRDGRCGQISTERKHSDDSTVINLGSASTSFSLRCEEKDIVKCEALSVSSITLAPGDFAIVTATYTGDEEGVGVLILEAESDDDDWKTAGYLVVRNCPNGCAAVGERRAE